MRLFATTHTAAIHDVRARDQGTPTPDSDDTADDAGDGQANVYTRMYTLKGLPIHFCALHHPGGKSHLAELQSRPSGWDRERDDLGKTERKTNDNARRNTQTKNDRRVATKSARKRIGETAQEIRKGKGATQVEGKAQRKKEGMAQRK